MNKLTFTFLSLLFVCIHSLQAQSVDEILDNYFENTGGKAQWESLQGIKMMAKVNQMGMEIPIEIVQLKSGKQMTVINFQGQQMKQGVFDGEVLWNINMMTQKAEKSDQETTDNVKREVKGEFPDPFLNYKEKGYTAELLGTEEMDGAECFKIKLTKKPLIIDGKEVENVSFYFFDTENYVPLVIHSEIKSGQFKGQISEIKMSDYQEVGGLYFPFSMVQGVKDQEGQTISLDEIILNPEIDPAAFAFPEETDSDSK